MEREEEYANVYGIVSASYEKLFSERKFQEFVDAKSIEEILVSLEGTLYEQEFKNRVYDSRFFLINYFNVSFPLMVKEYCLVPPISLLLIRPSFSQEYKRAHNKSRLGRTPNSR